jgi:hypothetical protein
MPEASDIRVIWYETDKEPSFKRASETTVLVVDELGFVVYPAPGDTVTIPMKSYKLTGASPGCLDSDTLKDIEGNISLLVSSIRDGSKKGSPWRGSRAEIYGVINGNKIGLAYAVDSLKPLFQEHSYDHLSFEEVEARGFPTWVDGKLVTLEAAYFHTGNGGATIKFTVDDKNEHILTLGFSHHGNKMSASLPMGSMEMVGWLHEATGRLLKEMSATPKEGRTFPFEYHPQGEVTVENGKDADYYFSWDSQGKHLLNKKMEQVSGPGFAMVSPVYTEAKAETQPCCERDHDTDGNCDRHPGSEVPNR